jgi:type II secretory pathway component GspD/PulD (secretin)
MDRILAMLDKPLPQVYVQAKVIEIRYDSNLEFGVEASNDRNPATDAPNTFFRRADTTFNPPSYLESLRPGAAPFQGATAVFKLLGDDVSDHGALDFLVRAVQTKGTAEILSQPALIATEDRPASIITGEKIPVPSVETHGTTTIVRTLFEQTGIKLIITPLFIGREYVKMAVAPEVSAVREFISGGEGTQVPIIAKRSATTTVTVRDGETLIIGGLLTTSTIESRAQIPILGDIPLLGDLFGSRQTVDAKSEVVFFITPRIIRARTGVSLGVIRPPEPSGTE